MNDPDVSVVFSHFISINIDINSKSKNNKQALGDVSTDNDWWGKSATPCSLAAGHGLIRLDELHWHSSYLNDSVYLPISPLLPLPFSQPLALLLHPPTVQRSLVEFTHTHTECHYVYVCFVLHGSRFIAEPLYNLQWSMIQKHIKLSFIDSLCQQWWMTQCCVV